MSYQLGSDKRTIEIAKDAVARVDAQMSAGNHQEAERLIDVYLSSPNRPFIQEFLAASVVEA